MEQLEEQLADSVVNLAQTSEECERLRQQLSAARRDVEAEKAAKESAQSRLHHALCEQQRAKDAALQLQDQLTRARVDHEGFAEVVEQDRVLKESDLSVAEARVEEVEAMMVEQQESHEREVAALRQQLEEMQDGVERQQTSIADGMRALRNGVKQRQATLQKLMSEQAAERQVSSNAIKSLEERCSVKDEQLQAMSNNYVAAVGELRKCVSQLLDAKAEQQSGDWVAQRLQEFEQQFACDSVSELYDPTGRCSCPHTPPSNAGASVESNCSCTCHTPNSHTQGAQPALLSPASATSEPPTPAAPPVPTLLAHSTVQPAHSSQLGSALKKLLHFRKPKKERTAEVMAHSVRARPVDSAVPAGGALAGPAAA
eukprot:NODE_1504_length_1315_cov_46.777778_g1491_i0.p1 GENE.NODE_1504_length_1315_cov_46.777778_g1491_i0~~NODE_1504_length_1315_cov_46.777778_g1491_i0.p1  ORF type:complete len:415 (-),score=139.57 NODE_1504_length_1315_cov_46.777778_g1491_i0:70-1182(-)